MDRRKHLVRINITVPLLAILVSMQSLGSRLNGQETTKKTAQPSQATTATAMPAGWPGFLGARRDGISTEQGLAKAWPKDGLKEVWRVDGGVGMSGVAVDSGRAITLVQREERQWLIALDAKTGANLWKTELAPAYSNSMGNGPRGTPAIAGGRIFAYTGEGILVCVEAQSGKKIWSHHVIKELNGKEAEYGMAASPLVIGKQVIVFGSGPQATLVAYDTETGKMTWKAGEDPIGYSSPTRLTVGAKEQLVAFAGTAALGIDPERGTVLWRYPFETSFSCNIAAPIAVAGKVFLSAGENHGSVLLDIKGTGQGSEVQEVWSSLGPKSVLRSEWQTPVLLDGYLYGMDNVGGAGPVTHLTCIEAATGKRMWQVPRFGKGNLIAADGKLLISTMNGEFVLAAASPEKYQELGRQNVLGSTRQAPSLAQGLVYLRDDREVVCLDLRTGVQR